ncbi:hypothetical protein IU500_01675 [Nocardia terpenica]|uniref:hypothetical protein n=1 Tax=Nocardia terpenica TaxID=455432 RepID=UPI001894F94B|nr:hypothetical protein [Nocardia terpenica]MBF6059716.1 hypothetical protein [Nocardia terpenica]MBF6102743.1 hypothetical protein [Nocardia terpenica]MBF6111066.1 hypothetical protein [Nocardia terpenica]MBF6117197.1 hypothetical protein [Nocardia terpenica]MBF6150962.1 hypothetical protein [Nocardia terpenica]
MTTIDSGHGGVIGAEPIAGTAPAAAPVAQPGPIQDLPLPQLPADLPPIEPPAFHTARKEFDDNGSASAVTPHVSGLGGGNPADPSAHAAAFGDPASPLLGAAHGALNGAQGVLDTTHTAAQGLLDNARSAIDHAPAALGGAAATAPAAAASPAAGGLPALPPLPADPVGALMNGMALPAIPGIDMLFKPFLDMLSSFGTGVMGALNPATILSQSSQVIQSAMQVGSGALKTVEQVWQGQAARSAQAAGQQAQSHGADTSQRGFDISKLTDEAAQVVQRGNVQLTAVAQSFAAQATALAPVILTPPAQATLMASATEHLGQAVAIVNATRGELSGYTGQLAGVVQQIMGSGGGPNPGDVAQAVAQNIGQPIMEQAQQLLSGGGDTATQAAGLGGDLPAGLGGTATNAASFGGNGAHPGSYGGGGYGGGGLGGLVGGLGSGATAGAAKPVPGASMPGRPGAGMPGIPFGPGMPGAPGSAMGGGSGFMGAPGAAQRNNDEEHSRQVQPYQSPTGNTDLTGALGESAPEVIGQTHSDEIINDYEIDQL